MTHTFGWDSLKLTAEFRVQLSNKISSEKNDTQKINVFKGVWSWNEATRNIVALN